MNDVCPLLLGCPDEKADVLGSSLHRKVSDDGGQCILNRFLLTAAEDADGFISARVANRAVIPGLSVLNTAPPNPSELSVGGHYLPSPVVCTLYGILDYVRIDALILDVVLEAFMLCDRLLDVVAVFGQPLEPFVRGLEYETSGSAFVKNNSFMVFNLYEVYFLVVFSFGVQASKIPARNSFSLTVQDALVAVISS